MSEFQRRPGGIDDPGMKGGVEPDQRELPPGDTAGDTGGPGEPAASELDLPGEDDPVAWSYVQPGTPIVDPGGERIATVAAMLGTEAEGIFHGIAVEPAGGGPNRVIPADDVVRLTPSRVVVGVRAADLEGLDEADATKGSIL
jgi:hypothetical protein